MHVQLTLKMPRLHAECYGREFYLKTPYSVAKGPRSKESSNRSVKVTGYEHDRYTSILQWIPRVEFHNFGTHPSLHEDFIHPYCALNLRLRADL